MTSKRKWGNGIEYSKKKIRVEGGIRPSDNMCVKSQLC